MVKPRNRSYEDLRKMLPPIIDGAEYYTLTFLLNGEGRLAWQTQTEWAGPSEERAGWERRGPGLVYPDKMLDLWESIGRPGIVVNDDVGLYVFLRIGGNCVIERDYGERRFPDFFRVREYARTSGLFGFTAAERLTPLQRRRAPTPKLRMAVLKRDGRRCRICGRAPEMNVDLDIDVHHIRPSGRPYGGLTEEANLLTLCDTCHAGLDPHYDVSLYAYLPETGVDAFLAAADLEYREGVERYRVHVSDELDDRPATRRKV